MEYQAFASSPYIFAQIYEKHYLFQLLPIVEQKLKNLSDKVKITCVDFKSVFQLLGFSTGENVAGNKPTFEELQTVHLLIPKTSQNY